MNKWIEYTLKSGKNTIEHGVCHRDRLMYVLQDDMIMTASSITEDAYAVLMEKWGGVNVEPIKAVDPKAA
jgi:hypothetical protein